MLTWNPGHIAWHADEGFAIQMIEREDEVNALQDATLIESTCANWNAYTAANNLVQDDSGI